MPAMASTPARWDRASAVPVAAGERVPEIVQLGTGLPDLATLFTFITGIIYIFENKHLFAKKQSDIETN